MATQAQAPAPVPATSPFEIKLQIVNGLVQPLPGDYINKMVVGDHAFFSIDVNPLPRSVTITFTPVEAKDKDGKTVLLVPFEQAVIRDPLRTKLFSVKNSCKSMMKPTMITVDGKQAHCKWDERGIVTGQTVCTGGGANPVHC